MYFYGLMTQIVVRLPFVSVPVRLLRPLYNSQHYLEVSNCSIVVWSTIKASKSTQSRNKPAFLQYSVLNEICHVVNYLEFYLKTFNFLTIIEK